jgi:SAM-dependent methyltransferase
MSHPHIGRSGCRACGSTTVREFLGVSRVPVHCNVLWPTREEALKAPRGDLRLMYCDRCGHIYNEAFDPSLMEYTQAYDNSLHFSPRFQAYARQLATRLVNEHRAHRKVVIDIGCGKGDFLAMLCEAGNNRGIGFDPSFVPENLAPEAADRMTIIQDFYSAKYASHRAALITCRHVLEHIQFPLEFVADLRDSLEDQCETVVFFEVPNARYTLVDLGIWDLIYEHCSYFTESSLETLFRRAGFTVLSLSTLYEGQFLGIDLVAEGAGEGIKTPERDLPKAIEAFAGRYREKVRDWEERLKRYAARGERVVVWGGGSKGVTFLNVVPGAATLAGLVDINPRKRGMCVPGTGQVIVGPEDLTELTPSAVIVMNSVYVEEIRGILASLGLHPEVALA